jgi:hypothetical protein
VKPLGEPVIYAAALVAALGALWRQVLRPTVRWARRLAHATDQMLAEFGNNGGSTLRDAVDRLTAGQAAAKVERIGIETVLCRVDQRTAILEEQLSDVTRRVVSVETATSLRPPSARTRATDPSENP